MKKSLIASFIVIFSFVTCFMGIGHADASTSRVAIITKWEGTVEVQKSGGKKLFKAFKNMSLNQGDIVTTGKDSSVVLQFSNGTSSDDTLTLEENSTVTFAKLKNKSGTTTKVRMQKGKAWVDVKSIQNKDDEFTLETPTAIMGVRGTNFFIGVDPETNASMMAVFAGIVSVGNNQTGDPTEEGASTQYVYPSMIFHQLEDYMSNRTITNADSLDGIMSPTSENVIRQLLENMEKIKQENESFINGMLPSNLPINLEGIELSLEDYYYNVNNVIEFILGAFIEKEYITAEKMQEIINELNGAGTNQRPEIKEPDFRENNRTNAAYEQEKERLQRLAELQQQQRDKEAAAKSKAEELKKQAEQKKLELLEMEKQRRAAAEAAYLAKLEAAERAAFEASKKEKERESQQQPSPTPNTSYTPPSRPTPTPTPTPTPVPDWGNESAPFVVYQMVEGQDDRPLEYVREGTDYFVGVDSIIVDGDSFIYIPVSGKYEVTAVSDITVSPIEIAETNERYSIPLSNQMNELLLSVTVRDQASNSTNTYRVQYWIEQEELPIEDPDWESLLNPFTVYQFVDGQEKRLDYRPEDGIASGNFVGEEIIEAVADSYVFIPAWGEYEVIEVLANGIEVGKTDAQYNIQLSSQIGDQLTLRVTLWDQASDSSYDYQVRYSVEQLPPEPNYEFELYTVAGQQGQQEEKLLEYEYIGGQTPTYRAEPINADELLSGLGHIKLFIPDAISVLINGEPYESQNGIYNLYLSSEGFEEYVVEVTTSGTAPDEAPEYIIELPIHWWWKDNIPFMLYNDPDMIEEIEMNLQDDMIVASVELGAESPYLLLKASDMEYTISWIEGAPGYEASATLLDDGVFELNFYSETREVVYEVAVTNKNGMTHLYELKLELSYWMDDSFLLYVDDEPVSYMETNGPGEYFYQIPYTDKSLKIRANEEFEIMGVMVNSGQQGQGEPIEGNPDGYYEFEIPETQYFSVDIYISGDGREGIIKLEIVIEPHN